MGGLVSGTGRAKKAFILGGLQAREFGEPVVVFRIEIAWHAAFIGAHSGSVCQYGSMGRILSAQP